MTGAWNPAVATRIQQQSLLSEYSTYTTTKPHTANVSEKKFTVETSMIAELLVEFATGCRRHRISKKKPENWLDAG